MATGGFTMGGGERTSTYGTVPSEGVGVPMYGARTVILDGKTYRLPHDQEEYDAARAKNEAAGLPSQGETVTEEEGVAADNENQLYQDFLGSINVETDPAAGGVVELLTASGIDTDAPEVQELIASFGDKLMEDPNIEFTIGQLRLLYPVQTTLGSYQETFERGGFTGSFPGTNVLPGLRKGLAEGMGGALADALTGAAGAIHDATSQSPKFQDGENGITRYRNGVLVDPSSSNPVVYDPDSTAAGSPHWFRDTVANWSNEEALTWGKRLHEMGYLTKEQAKSGVIDDNFRGALAAYHRNRYLNGGVAVVGEAALTPEGSKVAIADELIDFGDFRAQLRNDVRENYRAVYGTDPTDGEVKQMSNFIEQKGMELQRKYLRKGYGDAYGMAAAEATSLAQERIENEPEAVFLRESTEENTRLRDSFQRAAAAANAMAF